MPDELLAQPWLYTKKHRFKSTEANLSFSEIQHSFNTYWDGKEIEKGKGYKQFKRWEYFIEPRINTNNHVNSIAYWDALQTKALVGNYDTLLWKYVGPEASPKIIETDFTSGSGRLNCIAFHPTEVNTLYVGAPSGGLWISEDGGSTWYTTTDKLNAIGISDLVITTTDTSTVIYLATGDGDAGDTYSIGIIKSLDGGENWETTSLSLNTTNELFFRRIAMHPNNNKVMLATSSNGLYYTEDGWETYSLVLNGDYKDIEFSPGNSNIVYASSFDNSGNAIIYRSLDAGKTFTPSMNGVNTNEEVNRIELAVSSANPTMVLALCTSAKNGGFYALFRSTNSGASWQLLYNDTKENLLGWSPSGSDIGGQGWYDLAMAINPGNSNNIVIGGINNWKSTNGGTQWELSSWLYHNDNFNYVHADQHMLKYSPHNNNLYVVNDGGVYTSANNGETWSDITSNLQILQTYKIGSSIKVDSRFICGNQDNGTFLNDTNKWNMVLGGDGMNCFLSPTVPSSMFGSTFNGQLYKSTEYGTDFYSIKPDKDINGAWVTPFIMHPQNSNILYAAYKNVYKSNDAGESWISLSTELSEENLQNLAVSLSNDNYIYTATHTKLYKTTNGGTEWIEVPTGFSDLAITSICISPNDPNKIWLSLSGYNELDKVYYSANGGESWSNISEGLPNVPVNEIVMRLNSRNELFAATDIGVYYTHADTNKWFDYSINLPNVIVSDIEIIEPLNKLRAATYGRGIWEADLPEPLPSKANFEANILSGCLNAPIQLYYKDTVQFDSLVWLHPGGTLVNQSILNDTIEVEYGTQGKKTIQLKHYYTNKLISEIKFEYLDIRDTLDITLLPVQYNVCDSTEINIQLSRGYEYSWSPNTFLDTTKGNSVNVKPLKSIIYSVDAKHGTCNTILELPVLYMPDKICDATFLETGAKRIFSNHCATIEENEPIPPVGTGLNDGCISDNGWCLGQDVLENSLWFKVIVPDNGRVRVRVDGFDSQIALYSANECADLLTGDYDFIAANDDMSNSNLGSEIDVTEGLTVGDTLFLQLDGSFNGQTDVFEILVSDQPSSIKAQPIIQNSQLSIYPNPASDYINLSIKEMLGSEITIDFISITGKKELSYTINQYTIGESIQIKTSQLSGLYFLRISSDSDLFISKVLIK